MEARGDTDVHIQLFSLKTAGVEQILAMQQPLTVWAVNGDDARRLRQERLARADTAKAKALAIGLPWPKLAKGAGRHQLHLALRKVPLIGVSSPWSSPCHLGRFCY